MNNSTSKIFIAEVIGTFTLVALICGSILAGGTGLIPAVAGGLALMTMVYALGGISGGHFNPAVTLAATVSRRLNPTEMVTYWVAQLVGAFLAIVICQTLFSTSAAAAVSTPTVAAASAITAEAVATFFLALTVLGVTSHQSTSRSANGLAIGATLVLGGLLIGSLTGASLNPARSIAPAIMSGDFANLATYIIGPFVGAIVAGLVSNVLFTADTISSSTSSYNSNTNQQSRRAA